MLDIKFVRENAEIVKENIRKKFQDEKLPLVDEVISLDRENRDIKGELQALQAERNRISKSIGMLMKQGKKEEAAEAKEKVVRNQDRVAELSAGHEGQAVRKRVARQRGVFPQRFPEQQILGGGGGVQRPGE